MHSSPRKTMPVAQFKSELLNRTGRNLLPSSLPIETLIAITREMTLFLDGALGYDEIVELGEFLAAYLRKLLGAQGDERLTQFEKKQNELLPLLANELNEIIRDELVSRLIGYTTIQVSLRDLFDDHFSSDGGENSSANRSRRT